MMAHADRLNDGPSSHRGLLEAGVLLDRAVDVLDLLGLMDAQSRTPYGSLFLARPLLEVGM